MRLAAAARRAVHDAAEPVAERCIAPLSWGIYRNIPFALLGLLIIVLFYRSAKEHNDDASFRWMWLTIVLSFGFYIPVVLWADAIPDDRHADDPQDLRLRLDGFDRLLRDEEGMQVRNGKCQLSLGRLHVCLVLYTRLHICCLW